MDGLAFAMRRVFNEMEQPTFVSTSCCELGEGLALGADGTVAWLDIHGSKIFVLRDDVEQCFPLKSQATVIFRVSDSSLEFGSEAGIFILDLDTGIELLLISPPAQRRQGLRSNDGCYMGEGAYLMGFMHPSEPSINPGQLFYYSGDTWHLIDDEIAIPNTFLEISATEFLISDSLSGVVWKYQLDLSGRLVSKTSWMEFDGCTPDGGCVHKGYAFIALWDGGCVCRINLVSKERTYYSMPVPRPTNCAVAKSGATVWVTSARDGLSSETLQKFPLSGKTLSFEVTL